MSEFLGQEDGEIAAITAAWRGHRRRLIDIGYRILGSVSEAEDVADEAYARLVKAGTAEIDSIEGWLTTVASRLCIDRMRSASVTRRAYVGPWLPEPILTPSGSSHLEPGVGVGGDPADQVTLDESVRLALLVVLEKLSPAERTSFVLHDCFGIEFEDIGEIVGRSSAACRQLASRARRHIRTDAELPRIAIDREQLEAVAGRFATACASGEIEPLLEVLDPNVVGDFDSGGAIAGAPLRPVAGAKPVAKLLTRVFARAPFTFTVGDINGDPGIIITEPSGRIVTAISIGVVNGHIDVLYAIGNPAKLPR